MHRDSDNDEVNVSDADVPMASDEALQAGAAILAGTGSTALIDDGATAALAADVAGQSSGDWTAGSSTIRAGVGERPGSDGNAAEGRDA